MAQLGVVALTAAACYLVASAHGKSGVGSGEQDWGYATVRPGAHMFWWLYFTTDKHVSSFYDRPLVIWLQGGPGASSTGFGNFEELGPYDVNLKYRNYTWVKDYNVLFIDNPVGTGFSYAENTSAFATTNAMIATDLLALMVHFYEKLPEFRDVPVYITSESYGGKMAAEFAYVWYKAQQSGSIDSNLKGVGLGDSWISPIDSVLTWAPFLLQTGMVDTEGYEEIQKWASKTRNAVDEDSWTLATTLWQQTEGIIIKVTSNIDFYNILSKVGGGYKLKAKGYDDKQDTETTVPETEPLQDAGLHKLMNGHVKRALNLTRTWDEQHSKVFSMLREDFMKPVTEVVEQLLNETDLKVFVYTGQLDLIVDTPGTLLWVERLDWEGADEWKSSRRHPVLVDGIIEGYRKSHKNLHFYWINRAGHMVPADNPAGTAALLKDLTKN